MNFPTNSGTVSEPSILKLQRNSQSKNSNFLHYLRVSSCDSPLTKKPEDSGHKIGSP